MLGHGSYHDQNACQVAVVEGHDCYPEQRYAFGMSRARHALTEWASDQIRRATTPADGSKGRTLQSMANEWGVSKTHVINVRDGRVRVGGDLEATLARLFAGGSIDRLREVAQAFVAARPTVDAADADASGVHARLVPDDIYPNRALVRLSSDFMQAPAEVQAYVLSIRNRDGDMTMDAWLDELRAAKRMHARGALVTARPGDDEVVTADPDA